MDTLGERLVRARERAGLGQAELARIIGVSPGTLWRYEDDRVAPKTPRIIELAEALNCDPGWLLTGSSHDADAPSDDLAQEDPPGWTDYAASAEAAQLTEPERHCLRDMGLALVRAGRRPSPLSYAGLAGILRMTPLAATTS